MKSDDLLFIDFLRKDEFFQEIVRIVSSNKNYTPTEKDTLEIFAYSITSECPLNERDKVLSDPKKLCNAYGKFSEEIKRTNELPPPEYIWKILTELGVEYYKNDV